MVNSTSTERKYSLQTFAVLAAYFINEYIVQSHQFSATDSLPVQELRRVGRGYSGVPESAETSMVDVWYGDAGAMHGTCPSRVARVPE